MDVSWDICSCQHCTKGEPHNNMHIYELVALCMASYVAFCGNKLSHSFYAFILLYKIVQLESKHYTKIEEFTFLREEQFFKYSF